MKQNLQHVLTELSNCAINTGIWTLEAKLVLMY